MSPRSWTVAATEEALALPNLHSIEASTEGANRPYQDTLVGFANWGLTNRHIVVPPVVYTKLDLAVWLHEIGHMRTMPSDFYVTSSNNIRASEVLAWKWARATMGDLWDAEVAKFAAAGLRSYNVYRIRRMRRLENRT